MDLEEQCRESRLVFWERILRGIPIDPLEIDREILSLITDSSPREKMAFILLRAAATLAGTGTSATTRTLRIAVVYWFSNASPSPSIDLDRELDSSSLSIRDIVGLGLSWREAALLFGANPRDYSAYQRLIQALRKECIKQWEVIFGESMEKLIAEVRVE
jgi:hypothetical protein